MSTAYVFTLDGLAFAHRGHFSKGPIVPIQPQVWSTQAPIGASGQDADVETFVGLKSSRWVFRDVWCDTTEKDKLVSVFNAQASAPSTTVTFKTPQDSTGFPVQMRDLEVDYEDPLPRSLFRCSFTLVRRG